MGRLFPKLSTLQWASHSSQAALHMRLFFGLSLQKLFVHSVGNHEKIFQSSLTYPSRSSPDLEALSIPFFPIAHTTIMDSLSLLGYISMDANASDMLPSRSLSPPQEGALHLARLKDMVLTGKDHGSASIHCAPLLRVFTLHLETLRVRNIADMLTAAGRRAFCETISRVMAPQTLKVLDLFDARTVPGAEPFDLQDLRPILAFVNLEDIKLSVSVDVSFDDSWLAGCATSCPRLRKLRITGFPPTATDVVLPTLEGVAILVRHCPRLDDLAIDFDASFPGLLLVDDVPAHGSCNTAIDTIDVRYSRISSPFVVAAILSQLFPNLRRITRKRHEEYELRWRQVEEALPVLSIAKGWSLASRV